MLESSLVSDQRKIADDHFYRALDLFAEGKRDQAVNEYRAAVEVDPRFTDALHGLARALQDLERYDEAIELPNRLPELNPDDLLPHPSLSILYQKKGMIPEAEAEANKARVLGREEKTKKKRNTKIKKEQTYYVDAW